MSLRRGWKRWAAVLFFLLLAAVCLRVAWITRDIQFQSTRDEARKADAIIVLGAAEYNGKPSPALRARLDHAYILWQRGFARNLITTGGAGGDPQFTEAEVGRTYLIKLGVPAETIFVEREGESTVESVLAGAEIMHRNGFRTAIVVSDGYHIYRVKRILQEQGLKVYGSPREGTAPRSSAADWWLYVRQAIGYLLWEWGISI